MMKIYTSESKTSKQTVKSPKNDVINALLNFSKSLEVLRSEEKQKEDAKIAEVILN